MIIMVEDIPEEDIPEKFKTEIQDFVLFYCDKDKALAQDYNKQLRSLGFTGCLYDDDSYLNWRHTFEYDLVHELSKRSVIKFFLVTTEVQHDGDLSLHRCESLMTSVRSKDKSLVPIFEIKKYDIPDASEFYGLRTLTGLYSTDLRDGRRFRWLFSLPDTQKRKKWLEEEKQRSLLEWKKEEKLRREQQRLLSEKIKEKREQDRERRHKEELESLDKLAEEEIQREDSQKFEEEMYQKLLPRLKELATEYGKSPEYLYGMTKNRSLSGEKDDVSLQGKIDKLLETVNQLKGEQTVKMGDGPVEAEKAGATYYHIVIENADNSEIKIGPSYETEGTNPVLSPGPTIHRETRRQFTTDGAVSGTSSVDSRYHKCSVPEDNQETSSVEFDIPLDLAVAPTRITEGRGCTSKMIPPPERAEKKEIVTVEGCEKDTDQPQRPFNFNMFLEEGEESEEAARINEFSEDRKASTDQPGASERGPSTDENKNTMSMSTEVHVPSSLKPVTGSSSMSEAAVAPPWAPRSSSLSAQTESSDQLIPNQVARPMEDSLFLNTLDSTEIVINAKEAGLWDIGSSKELPMTNAAPSSIPEFTGLLSDDSFSITATVRPDDAINDKYPQPKTVVENSDIKDTPELGVLPEITELSEKIHYSDASAKSVVRNVIPEQPESTTTSLKDHSISQSVEVCVYDSETEMPDPSNADIITAKGISEHSSDLSQSTRPDMIDHVPYAPVQVTEEGEEHHPSAVVPNNMLRDSGIEMDQITETQGLLVSGYKQLSGTATSIEPDIQGVHIQESRPDPSSISYNIETGQGQGCGGEATLPLQQENTVAIKRDDGICAAVETRASSKVQPERVEHGKCVTASTCQEDAGGEPLVTGERQQVESEGSVSLQNKQSNTLESLQGLSTDEECLRSLDQLSGDLEKLRLTGTWV